MKRRTREQARAINTTGLKSFDRLAMDPRIKQIWSEGRDGYWASLVEGYNAEGCSAIHEWSVKGLLGLVYLIEEGAPY